MSTLTANTPPTTDAHAARRRAMLRQKSRLWLALYLLLLPTMVGMVLFNYYPKLTTFVYAFYRWDPGNMVEEFRGLQNFGKALDPARDPLFWRSFRLVGILLLADLIKMWPAIFTAIVLHRLRSDRARYIYQVLFVVPMIIPSLVWLLIWKSFYDPSVGLLNQILRATYLMDVLLWLDYAAPRLAGWLNAAMRPTVDPVFGSIWGLPVLAAMLLTVAAGLDDHDRGRRLRGYAWALVAMAVGWVLFGALVPWRVAAALGAAPPGPIAVGVVLLLALIPVGFMLNRSVGGRWVIWFGLVLLGLWAFGPAGSWRLMPAVLVAAAIGEVARRHRDLEAAGVVRWLGGALLACSVVLILLSQVWTEPTRAFDMGMPSWLGYKKLVVPAVILWGFPWVGTVGVLIYLAGLQQISQEVYEAAELDGVGPIGKVFRIELPLILTQVRINLIFLTIGTLTGYGLFYILLGADGGPDNVGMVPGLYMFRTAFIQQDFGYACALGLVMFVIILALTLVYQKYIKVEK